MRSVDQIIDDDKIIRVHANSNFGSTSPRDVVNDGVVKCAVGYGCGSTQIKILQEHGLVYKTRSYSPGLTKKGKEYARALSIFYLPPNRDI